ncbi:MAG: O-antigen ligase family protein [Betaproteobacteria bacterium]|nr:O-antigen ligase family protein [Betaproteobacteria bacterium]
MVKLWRASRWGVEAPAIGDVARHASFVLFAVYAWLLPIEHTIAARNLVFFPLVLLTLWAGTRREGIRLRVPFAWAWMVYGAVALISLTYAINPAYSAGQIKDQILYAMLALLVSAAWVNSVADFSKAVLVITAGATFLIGSALYPAFVSAPFWGPHALDHYDAFNDGIGTFSTYLITTLPFIWAYRRQLPSGARTRRMAFMGVLAGGLVALFLTTNRIGIIALAVEGGVAATLSCAVRPTRCIGKKTVAASVLIALVLVALFFRIQEIRHLPLGADPRIRVIWPLAIRNIESAPWSGGGFGIEAFTLRNPAFVAANTQFFHAHNMVLNKGVQMGIPGMVAFLLLWFGAVRAIWPSKVLLRENRKAWGYLVAGITMSAGVFLKNMTDDFFTNDGLYLYLLIVGALVGMKSATRDLGKPREASGQG